MNHLLIAGLGNPDIEYQATRHNIGFTIIDAIADHYNFPMFSHKFSALISSKMIHGYKITLIKPQTYMNLSGQAISKIVNFYKLAPENLIAIHDDLDLQFAKVKMKIGGGTGGHNGLKSIDQHLGNEYYRLRIGIGKDLLQQNVSNFVLNKFTKDEEIIIAKLINNVISKLELITARNLPLFMSEMALEQKKYGIYVGLPNVGKSTLFNALTQTIAAQAANYPFCTIDPNFGTVNVPDLRLDKLADDCLEEHDNYIIFTKPDSLNDIREYLANKFGDSKTAKLSWNAQTLIQIDSVEQAETLYKFIDTLEDNDDVQNVIGNFELSQEILEKLKP